MGNSFDCRLYRIPELRAVASIWAKGVAFAAILGGLVNSTPTAAEFSSTLPAAGLIDPTVGAVLLTSVAMCMRNLAVLAIF
jgi:uncharacterized membrane protein (DUF4010 family)